MLEVTKINTFYGTSHILFDVSLRVGKGEVVCLLGRNGAGKTTVIHSLMGLVYPRAGTVTFSGEDLTRAPSYVRAQRGLGLVADSRRIFPTLTVDENLRIGVKQGADAEASPWTIERVRALFPKLAELARRKGGHLSGGEQQMLAIGRTLMGNPTLLMMDEPAEGLAPLVVRALRDQVLKLKAEGQTMLVSEQNVPFALAVADRAYVIEKGRIRFEGSIPELEANEQVKRNYLMV